MTDRPQLNSAQFMTLKMADARFARLGLYATGEAGVLFVAFCAALAFLAVDFTLLHMLHGTYAEEGYHSTAFAASGLVVVLALHIVAEILDSKRFDRLLASAAAICALVFIVGTCLMIGTIALTQGIAGLSETFPSIDAFFDQAQIAIDEAFGPTAFESLMTNLAVPLFTFSVCTAFFLTVYLTKWLLSWLVRRVPVVAQRIADARQSSMLFGRVKEAMAFESEARSNLQNSKDKLHYWDNNRIADLLVSVREEVLRPFDLLLKNRRLEGGHEGSSLPIPHPDGGPPFDPAVMEELIENVRSNNSHDEISTALNDAQPV